MSEKKSKIIKIIVLIAVILLIVLLSVELLPLFKNIATTEGRIEFKETIEGLGPKGVFVILGLMVAQVLLAVLPGEPVQLLAGMCYGPIWGTAVIILGAFISTTIVFFAVRKFGRSFIYSFADKEKIEKLEKSKWFSNEKKLEIIFLILFLIPGTPKDLFVFIAGILPVKPIRFILISTFARLPAIISSSIIGDHIVDGNWEGIITVVVAMLLITGVVIWAITRKDKDLAKDIFEK